MAKTQKAASATRAPLGDALREAGITVDQMAKVCGCSNRTAWRWAMGTSVPQAAYRMKLKRFLSSKGLDSSLVR